MNAAANGPEKPRPSLAVIEALKNQGLSQSDIARLYGVTRQAISWHIRHYGGTLTPRQTVLQHWPFIVPADMGQASVCRRLRDHGEWLATGGEGMSEAKLSNLRYFYNRLRDEGLVIEFDPNIPPEQGVSPAGGWAWRKRRKSDEDRLIRVNRYTHLSDEGDMIWRFPPEEP